MKKQLNMILVAMAVVFSIASCQKNDELSNFGDNQQSIVLKTKHLDNNYQSRGSQPNPFWTQLNNMYGYLYEISSDSLKSCVLSNGLQGNINVWAFPCKYFNIINSYLTVIYISSSNIIGIYSVTFLCKNGDATESTTYQYEVYDPDGENDLMFTGSTTLNDNQYMNADVLRINSNSINIPSTYSYDLFDNISYGNVQLEEIDNSLANYYKMAEVTLRIAATFYVNYY